jgi:hypothetical protein
VRRGTGSYDAFLSYAWDPADGLDDSETSDAAVARRLRYAMQDLGKPRTRRSDLDVFLDRSVQTPSPDLWRGILDNLDRSRFLIVLCSPRSAASDGVAREVQHWLDTGRSLDDLLVVLLDGSAEEALPAPLRTLHAEGKYDPLFVDLRWVGSARDLDSRTSSRFREDVATLLAPIRGVAKETLVDEELTVRERGIRVQRRFIACLSVAVVVSLLLGLAATVQWRRADSEARIAESRALAAGAANQLATGLDVAQLLAVEGFRRDDNLQARATLLRATTASPRLVRYLDAGAPITVLTASAHGDTVVAGTDAGRVRRWAVTEDGPPRDLPGLTTGKVTAAAADAGGDTVAATDGKAVVVWSGEGPGAPVTLAPSDEVTALGLSPSGRWLVVALRDPASIDKGVLALVDRTGAVPIRRLPVGLWVTTIVLPDEDAIVALNGTGLWQRLRLSTGATLGASLAGVAGAHDFADAVAPDGAYYAWTNGDTQIPVWRTDHAADYDHPDLAAEAPGRSPEALAVAPGGGLVAVADSGDITVSRTRAPTGEPGGTATLTGNAVVTDLRFLDRDRRLVSASGNAVALWDLDQYTRTGRWAPAALPSTCNACGAPAVAVSPDAGFAALSPDGDGRLFITGMPTGPGAPSATQALVADGPVTTFRWAGPSTLEAVAPQATRVELRNGGAGGPVAAAAPVSAASPATLHGAVTVVVRTAVAADDADAAARARAAALLDDAWKRLPHGPGTPRAPVVAADHAEAAVVVDDGVWLIDLVGGGVTPLPIDDAYGVALTADRLFVSRASGTFEVRDRGTRAVVASIAGAAPAADGIATTPDGSLAARLRRDGTVEVVDIARAGVLGVLGMPGQTRYGRLSGLAFTADGASLVVAYPEDAGSGELDAYDLAPGRLVQVACATAGRDLTPAEWRQFVNDAVPDDLRCAR